jgi:hypothetical protein
MSQIFQIDNVKCQHAEYPSAAKISFEGIVLIELIDK